MTWSNALWWPGYSAVPGSSASRPRIHYIVEADRPTGWASRAAPWGRHQRTDLRQVLESMTDARGSLSRRCFQQLAREIGTRWCTVIKCPPAHPYPRPASSPESILSRIGHHVAQTRGDRPAATRNERLQRSTVKRLHQVRPGVILNTNRGQGNRRPPSHQGPGGKVANVVGRPVLCPSTECAFLVKLVTWHNRGPVRCARLDCLT